MAWQPLDALGVPALPTGTAGLWLDDSGDLIATDAATQIEVESAPSVDLAFPSNWPAVFKESATLKDLVNKNKLRGVRCRAVSLSAAPTAAARAAASASNVDLQPLHSFSNAKKLSDALGYAIVKGFVVFERPATSASGGSFVAVRHWWNAVADGAWIDLTPPIANLGGGRSGIISKGVDGEAKESEEEERVLLVESRLGEKEPAPLTPERRAFACALAKRLAAAATSSRTTSGDTACPPTDITDGEGEGIPPAAAAPSTPAMEPPSPADLQVARDTARRRPPSATTSGSMPKAEFARREFGALALGGTEGDDPSTLEPPAADPAGPDSRDRLVEQEAPGIGGGGGQSGDGVATRCQGLESRADSLDGEHAAADALFRKGDEEGAARMYEKIAAPKIEAAVAAKDDGNAAFKEGRMVEATSWYEAGLKQLGLEVGRFNYYADQCAAEFGRVLRKGTPDGLVFALHSNRAASLLHLERYTEAEAAASAALKERPTDLKARVRRANAYRKLGKPALACTDLAHAMQTHKTVPREIVSTLVDVWVERAPGIADFVEEVRAAAVRQGGKGDGAMMAKEAVERALCRGLHGMCQPGDWVREGELGEAALGAKGGGSSGRGGSNLARREGGGVVDGARLLARKSIGSLIAAAIPLVRGHENPMEADNDGARCLLRLCSWVVGIKGAMETERAILESLHAQIKSERSIEYTNSRCEALLTGEIVCISMLQLIEALARRRVSNLNSMHHLLDVLVRVFSFRASARVRQVASSTLAWCARCPKAKSFLFDKRYDERTLKPVNNCMKDYARHLNITDWVLPMDAPDYAQETGICLGDGTSRDIALPAPVD